MPKKKSHKRTCKTISKKIIKAIIDQDMKSVFVSEETQSSAEKAEISE